MGEIFGYWLLKMQVLNICMWKVLAKTLKVVNRRLSASWAKRVHHQYLGAKSR
jgi:hypothetical protein